VLPVGPGGVALNSAFQNRDTPQYKSELGLAIASLAGTCPDGLLVFFPSYGVLQSCIDHWKSSSGSGASLLGSSHEMS
jgi:regulator of telomere elongation helicase 1